MIGRIVTVLVGLMAALLIPAAPASADAEAMFCSVTPTDHLANSNYCWNEQPPTRSGYQVGFQVVNQPAGVTDYTWTVQTVYGTPLVPSWGCSGSGACVFTLPKYAEGEYYATVSYTANGVPRYFEAWAQVSRYCGGQLC